MSHHGGDDDGDENDQAGEQCPDLEPMCLPPASPGRGRQPSCCWACRWACCWARWACWACWACRACCAAALALGRCNGQQKRAKRGCQQLVDWQQQHRRAAFVPPCLVIIGRVDPLPPRKERLEVDPPAVLPELYAGRQVLKDSSAARKGRLSCSYTVPERQQRREERHSCSNTVPFCTVQG